jgi:hypothetical protein
LINCKIDIFKGQRVILDIKVIKVIHVSLEKWVHLEYEVNKVVQENQGYRDLMEKKVYRVYQDHQDAKAMLAKMVNQVFQVIVGCKDHQDNQVCIPKKFH